MRWFIAFLIVANVILYFWVQQQSRPLPGLSTLPSPDIGRLRLLSEVDGGQAHGSSEEPEPPLVDAEVEAMVEPPVAERPVAPSPPAAAEPLAEISETTGRPGTESSAYVEPFIGGAEVPDDPSRIAPLIPEAAEPTVTQATETESLNRPVEEIEEKAAQDVSEKVGRLVEQAPAAEGSVQATAAVPSQADPEDVAPVPDAAATLVETDPGDTEPLSHAAPPIVQVESEADEPVIDAVEPVVGTEQALCARVGPLESEEADEMISRLPASLMLLSDVSEDYATVDRYYVLIPPLPSQAAGRQKLKELADAGFTDTWLFPSGEYRNAISLGFFSRERGAKRHAANIADKGFITEVRGRTSTRKRRWLLLKGSGASDLASSLTLPAGVGLEPLDCP